MSTSAQEAHPRWASWTRSAAVSGAAASALNVAVLALMVTAVALRQGQGEVTWPGTPLAVFTLLGWLPLLGRNRWPVLVLALTTLVSAAQLVLVPVLDPDWETPVEMAAFQPVPIAVSVAAFSVALRGPRSFIRLAGIVPAVVLPVIAWFTREDGYLWTDLVMCNLILDGTALGALIAGRRDRLRREAQERQDLTRREVEAERLRIARELHDVLAHHLTLVNAQAGVADYLLRTDVTAAARALEGMAKHTRQALDELRATVGLLRELPADHTGTSDGGRSAPHLTDGEESRSPLPTFERLPDLVAAVRAVGTTIEVRTEGEPRPLAPGVSLAAYRVVQEALTNATKHAPGEHVTVDVSWQASRLHLRIENPVLAVPAVASGAIVPPTARTAHATTGGHGLMGMRERVRAAGGNLTIAEPGPTGVRDPRHTADARPTGSFVVAADLPTDGPPTWNERAG